MIYLIIYIAGVVIVGTFNCYMASRAPDAEYWPGDGIALAIGAICWPMQLVGMAAASVAVTVLHLASTRDSDDG